MAAVELNVRTELGRIVKELTQIAEAGDQVGNSLKGASQKIGEGLEKQNKKMKNGLADVQSFGRRVSNQLIQDFKALASVNALAGGLKFSELFRGSVKESFALNDSVRKLSETLGIADSQRAKFHTNMSRSMGAIGLSADAAKNALQGLSETSVRNQSTLISYARTAGMLASLSGQAGSEGEIAKGLAGVVTARGGNPASVAEKEAVASDVRRIQLATGKSATQILGAMTDLFSEANQQFQGRLKGGGGATLAAAALIGGQGSTAFLERYLKSSFYERQGLEARGFGQILNSQGGLNLGAMQSTLRNARGFGMGDEAAGLRTMGLSGEEAQGFIRLTKRWEESGKAIERTLSKPVDYQSSYEQARGFGEAWKANLNNVKGRFIDPVVSLVGEYGARGLNATAGSGAGSTAVVAASGVVAALLASIGLRGVGGALGLGNLAGGSALRAAGKEVQDVWVTNPGFGASGAGILPSAAGALGGASLLPILGVGAAALGTGAAIYANIKKTEDKALGPLRRAQAKDQDDKKLAEEIGKQFQLRIIGPGMGATKHKLEIEATSKDFKVKKVHGLGTQW